MNDKQTNIAQTLIALTETKIKYLQALNQSLHRFYNVIEDIEPTEIMSMIALQYEYRNKIDDIEKKYQKILSSCSFPIDLDSLSHQKINLDAKLAQYQNLLAHTAGINKKAIAKVQDLLIMQKHKINSISRKRNKISNFNIFNEKQTGNFYDYKEGNR